MAKNSSHVFLFAYAHWDREGHRTASEMRLDAVHAMDRLLELTAGRQTQPGIVLSGQSILVDDYLAVRANNTSLVLDAVRAGQLLVGPWFVFPHFQLVSQEALVRNLMIGIHSANQLGGSLQVGYIPEAWVIISQIPQLLAGFGIACALAPTVYPHAPAALQWQGPDGTSLTVAGLSHDLTVTDLDTRGLKDFARRIKRQASAERIVLGAYDISAGALDGALSTATSELQSLVKDVEIAWVDLPGIIDRMGGSATTLSPLSSSAFPIFDAGGSISNRISLKLRNQQVETLLTSWAEPFSAWAWLQDEDTPDRSRHGFMALDVTRHAWKTLLENHSQSTIGGCVADGVYKEALHRFDQAEQMAGALVDQSLEHIAAKIDTDPGRKFRHAIPVVVFNPTGLLRSDLVSIAFELPAGEQLYELVDDMGQPTGFNLNRTSADDGLCNLRFVANDLPAFGYRTYFLRPTTNHEPGPAQRDEDSSIENEFFTVTFDPLSGLLEIFDKRTGRSYSGLNHFVDDGDCGSLREHQTPARDTVIDIATNTPIFVERETSVVDQTLTFLQIYRLPRQLTDQRDARLPLAAQFVPVSITTQVRVIPGIARIDIRASISNEAMDHRLRVFFSMGSDVRGMIVEDQFAVRDLTEELSGVFQGGGAGELTASQRSFMTIWGADTGLTIANRGLHEVSVRAAPEGVQAALTLIRATGYLDDGEGSPLSGIATPLAQCRGEAIFHYSIIPHGQDMLPSWQAALAFQTDLRAVTTDIHSGSMPRQGGLVSIDNPRFVLTCVKTGDDGRSLIVRGYSISGEAESVALTCAVRGLAAQRARIDESPTADPVLLSDAGEYTFEVRPAEIVTIRLAFPDA